MRYLLLDEAAQLLPQKPNRSTIWRWAKKGVRLPDGTVVRLKTARFGRRLVTTEAWIHQFGQERNLDIEPKPRSRRNPRRSLESAFKRFEELRP